MRAVQVWVRERRAEGYQVAYETAKVTGYPTHLSLDITNPVIVTPSGQRWEGRKQGENQQKT